MSLPRALWGDFLREGGRPDDYRAGIEWLKAEAMIDMHPSGTYFTFTEKGAQRVAGAVNW